MNHSPSIQSLDILLGEPYTSMLRDLKSVVGYEEYVEFLSCRSDLTYLKPEIKALYELQHNGYLTKILSHLDGEPEGMFQIKVDNVSYSAIIEVAFVQILFDSNEETIHFINRELNSKKGVEFKKYSHEKGIFIQKKNTE